jgi:hypothetical protein
MSSIIFKKYIPIIDNKDRSKDYPKYPNDTGNK